MNFHIGLSPEAMNDYNAYYGSKNPVALPVLERAQSDGQWSGLARSIVGEKEYQASEYYNGWGRKYEIYWAVIGASVNHNGVHSLSLMRPQKAGELGTDAVQLMRLLVPHLNRALRIHRTMEELRATSEAAINAVDNCETAMLIVNSEGRVALSNRRANMLIRRGDGITVRDGRLKATEPRNSSMLEMLLRSAADVCVAPGVNGGGAMLVSRRNGRSLQLLVTPLRSSYLLIHPSPCALVLISDPDARPISRAEILRSLYQLTPAECRLADLLLERSDLSDVATRLRVTRETVRTMLKSVFRKTGTHRQSELVGFLLRLPARGPHSS